MDDPDRFSAGRDNRKRAGAFVISSSEGVLIL